ncbi:MAG: tRNA-binding protein [Weeksellaceae bacterium]|nr:tRNA-binding protein [Weeksellaceae bacterium]
MNSADKTISWEDFEKIAIRSGTILTAELLEGLRKPAVKLDIDFGSLGIKKSSAQLTCLYSPEDLIGKQIVAVVNFPPKQIRNFFSECLVLGVYGNDGEVTLLSVDKLVHDGSVIG